MKKRRYLLPWVYHNERLGLCKNKHCKPFLLIIDKVDGYIEEKMDIKT